MIIASMVGMMRLGGGNCEPSSLYGMSIGQTSYRRALNIIADVSAIHVEITDKSTFWTDGLVGNRVYLNLDSVLPYRDAVALELHTYDETPILSLGHFIDSGCSPVHTYRINATGPDTVVLLLVFGTSQQTIAAVDAHTSVQADSAITDLWLVPPQSSARYLADIRTKWHFDEEIGWLGYAPIEDYWAQVPIN
ncbi:MAG: hypothetical protein GC204_14655 [Chloroflexi bacterium]|nr:hypothetical protein [Chloroflexota bacterium]